MASAFLPALLLAAPQPAQTVQAMRWEERVLVVFAPSGSDPDLAAQRRRIAAQHSGFSERDLRVVEVVGESVSGARDYAPRMRSRYRIAPGEFAALLIGKDGAVKLRANRPIDTATLFDTIDAMPMRQREMASTR